MSMPRYSPIAIFLYTSWGNLAASIPSPHTTRFVVRSGELPNSKCGRSATGTKRPIWFRNNQQQAAAALYMLYIYMYVCIIYVYYSAITVHTGRLRTGTTKYCFCKDLRPVEFLSFTKVLLRGVRVINGHLDERAWFKHDFRCVLFKMVSTLCAEEPRIIHATEN